jgi:hypothetical protein
MRTIYLQRSLSINGRSALGGRALVDRLRQESGDLLLGAYVFPEEKVGGLDPQIRRDVISEVELLTFAPTVIVIEGGLFSGKGGAWRVERALAEEFVSSGGTLIVADVDVNALREQRAEYREVSGFLGASAQYRGREPVLGYDERRFWEGNKQILCRPDRMIISDWLRPVYDGIPEILCGLPVRLAAFESILASGNTDSTWSDATDGIPGPDNLPWATVRQEGAGFIVFMSANVTGDAWLEGGPHNTAWLVNVCRFLSEEATSEQRRAQAVVKSQESLFLSHASPDKGMVSEVFRLLTGEYAVGSWIDAQELLPGDSLPEHIEQGIVRSTAFVVFWSAAAARSMWVQRELDIALGAAARTVLLVRLDDTEVPERLSDLLRVEAADLEPTEIARKLAETIQRRRLRARIAEASERGAAALAAASEKEAADTVDYPSEASLTQGPEHRLESPTQSLTFGGSMPQPQLLATIKSDFRIDVLSFFDAATLVCGSGNLGDRDVDVARGLGLIDNAEHVNCQTGMDGHLEDQVASRRHLLYGYEDVKIFDRNKGDAVATIRCEDSANVMSAAWSPDGARVIVGSTNYLTIADDRGTVMLHKGVPSPKSVAWQPSLNPCYVTGQTVTVADAQGRALRTLTDLASLVVAVSVSPCGRYLAGSAMNGDVAIWSEWGELLVMLPGIESDGWHASRCLVFSRDSRYLCQAACTGGDGFLVFELPTGKSVRIAEEGADLLTFHPTLPDVLVTAARDKLSFWRLTG